MRNALLILAVLLMTASTALCQSRSDSRSVGPKNAILLQRSIFSRTRIQSSASTPSTQPTTQPATRPSQGSVLTGVAIAGGGHGLVAFIEDLSGGNTALMHVGDSLGGGKISCITLEYIEYASAGRTTRITVGQNLEGSDADPASAASPTTSPTTMSSSSPADAESADSVIERLRKRRQQELGH